MTPSQLSRRSLLAASAAALACGRRKAVAFSGYCFVANQQSRSVAAVDLSTFKVRKHIPLDAAPAGVIGHPTAARAFVLAPESGTVFEVDGTSLAVSRRVRAGGNAVQMQLAPKSDALWVLYRDPPSLVELPLKTLRPGRRIRLAAPPDCFDLSNTNLAAVAMRENRTVAVASLATGRIEKTIQTGDEPSILRFQGDGKQLITGSRPEKSLGIFSVAEGKVVVRLPLAIEPRHFLFNADGGQLFVSGPGMDAVVVVYPYRTEIAETMLAGRAPDAMAATRTPPFLLVANPQTDTVTILNFDSMGKKLVAAVQVGREPRHITVTPDGQWALVLNRQSGDMAVIRIPPLVEKDSPRRYRFPSPLFTMIPVGQSPVSAAVVAFS